MFMCLVMNVFPRSPFQCFYPSFMKYYILPTHNVQKYVLLNLPLLLS